MAVASILDAFGYKWAQTGSVEALTDDQWKAGWAFIGALPPSVEQFNKWGQISDEKSNYLYAQMKAVFDAAGEVPDAADLNSLRDAMLALVNGGRLIAIQMLTASGTYVRSAGATRGRARLWGAGAGGSGSVATTGTQICVGRGGGAGAYLEHYFSVLPASQAFTIGAGGPGGTVNNAGQAGGATIFGTLSAPGAPATATPNAYVPPALESGGLGAAVATGGNLVNASGQAGLPGQALTTSSLISGGGAGNNLGGGGNPLISTSANGVPSPTRGAGGSGASNGASTAGFNGGSGGNGLIIIEEYA